MFITYIKENLKIALIFLLCVAVFSANILLYGLPLAAVYYPLLLCFAILAACAGVGYYKSLKKHNELVLLCSLPENLCETLKAYKGKSDEDYLEIIRLIFKRESNMLALSEKKSEEILDYYTTWVHQIKTPIASMRLTLQNEDSASSRKINEDLFKIEQYVEMVLTYLRLGSESTDYVFKKHRLDDIIKGSIRKFAGQFIGSGIRLELAEMRKCVITDEKWLAFVIEQVISNAVKYCPGGTVKIFLTEPATLCISDSGMGIYEEDLPRIFDRGYTGFNGRADKKASGLGLYLCRRICDELGHKISAESVVGQGTTIKIDFTQNKIYFE